MRVRPSFINLLASRFARPRKAQLFGLDREDFFYLDAFVMKMVLVQAVLLRLLAKLKLKWFCCFVCPVAGNASAKL